MSSVDCKPKVDGFARLYRALCSSCSGFKAAWRREAAFRQELCAAALLFPLAWFLGDSAGDRALLIGSVAFVLIVELINTAIEATVDLISPAHHPLAAIAKDTASAAVLGAILVSACVWIAVLW